MRLTRGGGFDGRLTLIALRRVHSFFHDLRDGKTSRMKRSNAARNEIVVLAPTRSRPEVDKIRASSCSA